MKRRTIGCVAIGVALAFGCYHLLAPAQGPFPGRLRSAPSATVGPVAEGAGEPVHAAEVVLPAEGTDLPELSENARSERVEQFILRIEEEDGGLFMRLKDLPAERRDALKRTMAENSVALMEVFRTPSGVDLGTRIARAQAEGDGRVRALLGDADFERYSLYQSSRAYRATVGNLANAMRAKGVGVSLELEQAMLDAYTEAAIEAAQPLRPGAEPAPDKGGALATKKVGALLDGAALDAFLEAQIQRE